MIVLDENGVEKARAMIRGAARPDGVLFQHPQRRGRLPRVEDRDGSAARLDEPARARGDAREPLKKIERGALADNQGTGRAEHLRDLAVLHARAAPIAVAFTRLRAHAGLDLPERLEGDLEAGQHAIGFHEEHPAGHLRRGDRCLGRDVAVAQVFIERAAHDVPVEGLI